MKEINIELSNTTNRTTEEIADAVTKAVEKALKHKATPSVEEKILNEDFSFSYKSTEQLYELFCSAFSQVIERIVREISRNLDLPDKMEKGLRKEYKKIPKALKYLVKKIRYFKFKTKILVHPDTGQPISSKVWDRLERTIVNNIKQNGKGIAHSIINSAYVLGKLLSQVEEDSKRQKKTLQGVGMSPQSLHQNTDMSSVAKEHQLTAEDKRKMRILQQKTCDYITNMAHNTVTGIKETIQSEIVAGNVDRKQIAQKLQNKYADTNRDMQRIASFEIKNTVDNAFLAAAKEQHKETFGEEKMYMQKIEGPSPCEHCKKYAQEVVLVVDRPLSDDRIEDEHAQYAIWEGKSNVGRKKHDWWLAYGAQHPHCECTWIPWHP